MIILDQHSPHVEFATFAAGSFWQVEQAFDAVPGVIATRCGYAACQVEAVRVWFDPSTVCLEQLIDVFWECHDPTTHHRIEGGSDYCYRSAIFVSDMQQQIIAAEAIARERLRRGRDAIVTTRVELSAPFQQAAAANQQNLQRPGASERLAM